MLGNLTSLSLFLNFITFQGLSRTILFIINDILRNYNHSQKRFGAATQITPMKRVKHTILPPPPPPPPRLTTSAWNEYVATGTINGHKMKERPMATRGRRRGGWQWKITYWFLRTVPIFLSVYAFAEIRCNLTSFVTGKANLCRNYSRAKQPSTPM